MTVAAVSDSEEGAGTVTVAAVSDSEGPDCWSETAARATGRSRPPGEPGLRSLAEGASEP